MGIIRKHVSRKIEAETTATNKKKQTKSKTKNQK